MMQIPPTHFEDWQSWSLQKGDDAELTKSTGTAPDRVSAGHFTTPSDPAATCGRLSDVDGVAPKGLGWDGYKPLMRSRRAYVLPSPTGIYCRPHLTCPGTTELPTIHTTYCRGIRFENN